jgi:hypothetical protein
MMTILRITFVLALALVAGCGSSKEKVDAGPIADSFGGLDFGQPCTTATDCPGGLCADTKTGGICTTTCDTVCPEGWSCRVQDQGGNLESICVPQQFDYCTACTTDSQCAGGVCVDIGGAKACIAECPFHANCPTGYTCGSDPTGAHDGSYCLPLTNDCSCTVAQQGEVRTCTKTNSIGTCRGIETCDADAGGWVGCSAPTPAPETCDGIDNDCDQLIDEGVGGSPCQNTVAGVGSCTGITRCQGRAGVVCEGQIPMPEICNYLDDNCNGQIDETWPTLASACSVGVGACQRFGVTRCNAAGTGTECSVTAGSPTTELCNGIDDNCNGQIDETFPTLGQACTVGVGICQRQGNLVCNTAQTGVTCSVAPGPPSTEVCNGLDDNCDGIIDNGFLNPATGLYDKPTACGSCTIDCTVQYAAPNASGTCVVVSNNPQCKMVCNANAFDLDGAVGDGCEFLLDTNGVYVSTNDAAAADDASCGLGPVGTGSGVHPCKTIAQGIARANTLGRAHVLVANGIYAEAVTLSNGRSLLGGYAPDSWQRNVASTGTYITGVGTITSTNHQYAVFAANITSATVFEGFVVLGPSNTNASGNSYAVYVSTGSGSLSIQNNVIIAGAGGEGVNGGAGASGAFGVNGAGRASNPAAYDAFETNGTPCAATNNRQYSNGGVLSCGGNLISGGNGGGNKCAPSTDETQFSAINGIAGGAGSPTLGGAAGALGAGGSDMVLDSTGNTCFIGVTTGWHDYGFDGGNGGNGQPGTTVAGCTALSASGTVVSGHWVGGIGTAGVAGGNGAGGGGGGAGGGGHCNGCPSGHDDLGGVGGGGASGGCGGSGGGQSTAGGGAFGIFIVGGSAPVITGNQIQRGQGAAGGRGGAGAPGGAGGVGGDGGTSSAALFCTAPGGRGGNGGDGGNGSGGGGACGGTSVGIFTSGIGTTMNYCQAAANNTVTGGAGGAGGPGGYSIVNQGGAGTVGVLTTCSFN